MKIQGPPGGLAHPQPYLLRQTAVMYAPTQINDHTRSDRSAGSVSQNQRTKMMNRAGSNRLKWSLPHNFTPRIFAKGEEVAMKWFQVALKWQQIVFASPFVSIRSFSLQFFFHLKNSKVCMCVVFFCLFWEGVCMGVLDGLHLFFLVEDAFFLFCFAAKCPIIVIVSQNCYT